MNETSNNSFCLLFDSDGTLVDSELLNCEAMSAELAVSGIVEHPEHLLRNFRGYMFSAVLDELQQKHQIQLDDGFNLRFRERAAKHFVGRLEPIAGVPGSLAQLSNPMCVVSNGPESKLELALRLTGLNTHFEHVFSAYTVGSWKPDPDLFHHAAKRMGYAADRCIVIEDSRVGIEAACSAGMNSILYSPEPPGSEPHVSAASIVIASMAELPNAVMQLQNGYGESS